MAADGDNPNPNNNNNGGKGKKRKYLPHGRPVRKGLYPLRPGVQGFFITCDGGRERQATNEALSLLDTFYEELVDEKDSGQKCTAIPSKPLNKITKFEDSDSSGDEDESSSGMAAQGVDKPEEESEDKPAKKQCIETDESKCETTDSDKTKDKPVEETEDKPALKQCVETGVSKCETINSNKTKDKPIDELIEDELKELGDRNKRHFVSLDSGCNGCIFIQMHRNTGDTGPASIAQHMMSSAAATRKHMSRFILRVLPVEVTCYSSEEEISKAIKPLIEQYFPTEASTPQKFAVLYEARANTGVDRMTIINAVAKSVPQPHKVDLTNPDKTIIVQIAKTICMIGVAERYKQLSKYNLRQLTTPQQ